MNPAEPADVRRRSAPHHSGLWTKRKQFSLGLKARFINARSQTTYVRNKEPFLVYPLAKRTRVLQTSQRRLLKSWVETPLTDWSINLRLRKMAMKASGDERHTDVRRSIARRNKLARPHNKGWALARNFLLNFHRNRRTYVPLSTASGKAFIQNFNVFIKPVGDHPAFPLSFDGSTGNYYTLRTISWSPDSKRLVAYHTRPGYDREIMYIESSPRDQIQPKHTTVHYLKPGDTLDIAYPVLFDLAAKEQIQIDHALFPNAYSLSPPVWWKDSRGFTFEYNERGHQTYSVIEIDAQTGKARDLITERSKTFIYYNKLGPGLSAGRRYRHDVNDGKEIIWASERDGWEHLYLYDGLTGEVKNQITKGEWLVRNVDWVDDQKHQIWFEAGGSVPGEDPYFTQAYRINFDGTGLTRLTEADATHSINFSRDHKYYVDTWQRVDLPPVAQLRRSEDMKVTMDLDKGDASALLAAGFKYPEVFVAKGRDG